MKRRPLDPQPCSPEEIAEVIGSQPVTPPPEFIDFLERHGKTARAEGRLLGLFYPYVVQLPHNETVKQVLRSDWFVVAYYEWWHEVSHRWSESERWLAFYDHAHELQIHNLGEMTPTPVTSLDDLVTIFAL